MSKWEFWDLTTSNKTFFKSWECGSYSLFQVCDESRKNLKIIEENIYKEVEENPTPEQAKENMIREIRKLSLKKQTEQCNYYIKSWYTIIVIIMFSLESQVLDFSYHTKSKL